MELVVPISLSRLFGTSGRRAIDSIVPRRTFDDVILPLSTRCALDNALAQVIQHDLIFRRWGLGEGIPLGLLSRSILLGLRARERPSAPKQSRTRSVAIF